MRPEGALGDPTSPESAADVVAQYYSAIGAGDFGGAFALWADSGAASGKSFDEFVAGYDRNSSISAVVGEPGRVEGAAGSRYVHVPVGIRAVTRDGEEQRFRGDFVLRRTVVDGATEAQRGWHIHSAEITPVR